MKNFLFLFLLFAFSLFARENPFEFPKDSFSSDSSKTKKRNKEYPPFTSVEISLPSKFRVLKEISLKYQNIDGSIEEKIIKVDKESDWHDPFILIKKSFLESLKNKSEKKDTNLKKSSLKKTSKSVKKTFKVNEYCKIVLNGKNIKIYTSDKIIRSFMMINPYKIVLDFRNPNDVESKTFSLSLPYIKRVVVGNHTGYYRLVFELDGNYKFSLKKFSKGYSLSLK